MARDRKIRLGIIFGGRSGEHAISIRSAASVIDALNPEEFEITAYGITRSGSLADADGVRAMLPAPIRGRVLAGDGLEPAQACMRLSSGGPEARRGARRPPQIVFPLLHGPYGEDGTVQGLLEIAGVPYIGCGVLASAVGMDKDVMKRLFLQAGLPVAPFVTALARDVPEKIGMLQARAEGEFGYPMFSKPANLGSSVGIRKIHGAKEFAPAVRHAARFDRKIVIEKGIDARELECAILGNEDASASVVGEIFPAHEFYDYEAKYRNPESRLEIPARLDAPQAEEVRALALRAFHAIDGSGLSRVDFFLERGSGKIWINEINTMPGFTPISMYTKLWAASGVPFDALVRRLVELGEERFRERFAQTVPDDGPGTERA